MLAGQVVDRGFETVTLELETDALAYAYFVACGEHDGGDCLPVLVVKADGPFVTRLCFIHDFDGVVQVSYNVDVLEILFD